MDLFFVRGGYVYPNDQQLWGAGQEGRYWSSRAYSDVSGAYTLRFDASGVNLSYSSARYYGFPLRCLIPTP